MDQRTIKACPHLYPETGDFVAVSGDFIVRNGKFVSGNRRLCCRNGNKVACFRIQSCRFRQQVWRGLYRYRSVTYIVSSTANRRLSQLPVNVSILSSIVRFVVVVNVIPRDRTASPVTADAEMGYRRRQLTAIMMKSVEKTSDRRRRAQETGLST